MSALTPGLRTVAECITKTSKVQKKLCASSMSIEGRSKLLSWALFQSLIDKEGKY